MSASIRNSFLYADANLVALYELEDVNDSKASYTLTNHATVPFNAAQFGNGAEFPSSNSTKYLDVASNLGLAGNGNMSVSFWYKRQVEILTASNEYAVYHSSTTTLARYLGLSYYESSGKNLYLDSSGTGLTYAVTLGTTWHYIVIVRDVSNSKTQLYLDGSQVGGDGTIGTGVASASAFSIGSTTTPGLYTSSAIIDDVAVFSRALTSTEISNHFSGADSNSKGFIALL